jgi:hypothetical protein
MASQTEICNLALSHIGSAKEITNIETERSQEALACRRYYTIARDMVLRDFEWPFATRLVALGLVESDPNDEWRYSYRYPTDCLFFRRILSGVRNERPDQRIPHKIASDDTGKLIYTDQQSAEAEYTILISNTDEYHPDFVMALSYMLASLVASRLTQGDPLKLGTHMLKLYEYAITKAQASAANEENQGPEPESSLAASRE